MSGTVRLDWRDQVALVTIDNRSGHSLTVEVLAALDALIAQLGADPKAHAVVLTGAAPGLATGEALDDRSEGPAGPTLAAVCARLEGLGKPVIACLDGAVLGAALELALAAHWRLAAAGTTIGFPEVTLGLLPEAGGTQRAARLAGAKVALDLLLSGRPIGTEAAEAAGLIDGMLLGDVTAAAVKLAESMAGKGVGLRPTMERRDGFADPSDYLNEVVQRRAAVMGARITAEARIVDCVEAALLLPADEGLTFERNALEDCRNSPESRALRHVQRAERRAAEVAPKDGRVVRPGIIDGGATGAALVVALLDTGLPVVLAERDAAARDAAQARIKSAYASAVEAGRIGPGVAVERLAALTVSAGAAALSACDFVIEAPDDSPVVRRQTHAQALAALAPDAHLALLNPEFGPDTTADATGGEDHARVLGLHFLGPVRAARAVEVAIGPETPPDAVSAAVALVRQLGRIAVCSAAVEGLIGDRVYAACRRATDRLLEDGASIEEVDEALRGTGFPLGPYQMTDLAGLDSAWARLARQGAATDGRLLELSDTLCEAGRLGRRAGRGYYRYGEDSRRGQPDPVVAMLLAEERAKKRIEPRRVGQGEIRRKALAAMANEGARLVSRGVARCPSDVDVVMLHGFGFPRWLGGPMQWADEAGLLAVRDDLRRWSVAEPGLWSPDPLWDDLIKNGRKFADLGD